MTAPHSSASNPQEELARLRQQVADLTHQLEAIPTLKTEIAHLREILMSIVMLNPYSMILYDAAGHPEQVNPAFKALFQTVPPPEYCFFEDPVLTNNYPEEMAQLRAGNPVRFPEIWYNIHDVDPTLPDHPLRLSAVGFPVRGLDGNTRHYVIMHTDTTDREHTQSELRQAYEQLKALDRMKDEFITSISHEMRTPLTNLKLYYTLLQKQPDNPLYMDTLKAEIDRMHLLLEGIITISQLDQGHIQPEIVPTDLNAVAAHCVDSKQGRAEACGVALRFAPGHGLPPVNGDPELLEKVLCILVRNALCYTPEGGEVHVRLQTHHNESGLWVGLIVQDSGQGIPPDEMPRLFERFFRGRIALETGTPGAGLGLAIARQLVERQHGYIDVNSGPQGTSFTVWLPAATR